MTETVYTPNQPCVAGSPFSFPAFLFQRANSLLIQTSPTLAAGDVKISIDGGGYTNITNLPTEVSTSGELSVTLTATETTGATKYISVKFSDAAGAQWSDVVYVIDIEKGIAGPGAITWVITIEDADDDPIDEVAVWITTDAAGESVVASGTTNSLGTVTFYLDAGTYYVWKQKAGWTFTNPQTTVVA